ncbi:hypothetical protein HOLleu_28203 [Holothuria leucospilota]|uniref:Uncharacterized protein n=1 Tax=Holothuria leucospilota TaxID=206669 RepID=A0A9Q1BLM7_HOLLE|nr:hypothetical protein HOLleu_28203 [Holothuria leucospilota]
MANMDQIISAHKKYILTKQNLQPATQNNCNCRTQSQVSTARQLPHQQHSVPSHCNTP